MRQLAQGSLDVENRARVALGSTAPGSSDVTLDKSGGSGDLVPECLGYCPQGPEAPSAPPKHA